MESMLCIFSNLSSPRIYWCTLCSLCRLQKSLNKMGPISIRWTDRAPLLCMWVSSPSFFVCSFFFLLLLLLFCLLLFSVSHFNYFSISVDQYLDVDLLLFIRWLTVHGWFSFKHEWIRCTDRWHAKTHRSIHLICIYMCMRVLFIVSQMAVTSGDLTMVKLLIAYGAKLNDLNAHECGGLTPLHFAAKQDHIEVRVCGGVHAWGCIKMSTHFGEPVCDVIVWSYGSFWKITRCVFISTCACRLLYLPTHNLLCTYVHSHSHTHKYAYMHICIASYKTPCKVKHKAAHHAMIDKDITT